jgi:hypothetical protein
MGLDIWFTDDGVEAFSANITHNLNTMAEHAGVYTVLWRPEELNITTAEQLTDPLLAGLKRLRAEPEHFKQFNAPNGWGLYEHFVPFVEEVLLASLRHPKAKVVVSR